MQAATPTAGAIRRISEKEERLKSASASAGSGFPGFHDPLPPDHVEQQAALVAQLTRQRDLLQKEKVKQQRKELKQDLKQQPERHL